MRDSRIKIGFLISSFRTGGKEKFTADVLTHLDKQQFDPFLCVMKDGELLDSIPDERVYQKLAWFRGDFVGVAWTLYRILRREKPQILVAVGNRLDSWVGRFIGWWLGVPVRILELHGARVVGNPPLMLPDRWLNPLTTHYLAIGPDMRDQLIQIEGIPPEKITLILNGVDTDIFRPQTQEKITQIRRDVFHVPSDVPLIGCVAGLRPEKNLGRLIRAVAQLPNAHLVIIGEGSERPKLERLIQELQAEKQVQLLGVRRDVADLLPAFEIVALTSLSEATPLAVMEAAACGIPVVATAVGSIPEMVKDGVTGFVIPSDDLGALVEKLTWLLAQPDQRQQMGQAARAHAIENFSLQASIHAREALFKKWVDG